MFVKVTILFAALAAVHANALLYGHGGIINTGISARSQVQDKLGNYAFGYDIKDGKGASNSRSEVGDGHGNVKGSYTLADIDGRARKVEYVADGHGFRTVVKTNEPGTAASAPAAALIASPYAGPVAPVVNHVAPVGHGGILSGGVIGHGGIIGLGGLGLGGLGGHGIVNGLGLGGHGVNGIGLRGYGVNGIGLGGHGVNGLGLGVYGLGNGRLYH